MMRASLAAVVVLSALVACGASDTPTPNQIHIALTDDPSEVIVSWATESDTGSVLQWGTDAGNLTLTSTGFSRTYSLLDIYHSPHLHTATAHSLSPAQTVYYRCGDGTTWSPVLNFTTPAPAGVYPQRVALIADHGHTDDSLRTLSRLSESHQRSKFSALLLAGDLSYADGWQPTWDKWMNQIQPLASTLPWMVTVGNHEYVVVLGAVLPNLKAYDFRFQMPRPSPLPPTPPPSNGENKTLYYSIDIGSVHAVALNSENTTDFGAGTPMYDWLEADLKKANANRAAVPWVVVYWHRPWYSSNHVHGNDTTMRDQMESLLVSNKVNLVHNGHVHAYERTHPIVNGKVVPPGQHGIVYLTNGMAGNGEGLYSHWETPQPAFSAFHLAEFGHTEMNVINATHAHLQMILNVNGTVADDYWITQ